MNQPDDPNVTADIPAPSDTPDSLDAGLAAGFGRPMAPRSSLGDLRPVLLKEAEGESAHIVKPHSDAMPPKEETGDRYRLDGEIARGGMGAVLRGRDVDLGRDLAVKVLLEKYADRPDVARRFIEEAQIGGQLQHPGVVPVYDIGRFGDRPYFTMKLVKGHTLAAILEDRADATADRPRLLGIALKIAETLAYAHAKGVIHRDLKPANVMVGAFGEVQVMDWGLAKVLAEGGIADEERAGRAHRQDEGTQIRTARSSGSTGSFGTETEAGSLLGTPAYMPPEQANGDTAHLDRRADVFGLGAIVCEILTGKPPYVGRSSEEVRRKAANGDLADATARLDACGADAELIAQAKKCLSPEATDRPKDAQEVTEGLTAYLNGVQERLQSAERERAVAVVREAEQRKKRKVQLALATAVALLLLGGGAFGWWQNVQVDERRLAEERAATDLARLEGQQNTDRAQRQLEDAERAAANAARLARNAEAVAALLVQCEDSLRAGNADKAQVALEAARKRSTEGGAENGTDRLARLDADLKLLRELDAIDRFRWTPVDNKLPDPAIVTNRTWEALKAFGADPATSSVAEAAARVSASVLGERTVTALDRLLRSADAPAARAVLRQVDADPYRDAVRDAVLDRDPARMAKLSGEKAALEQPAGFAAFMGESEAIGFEKRRLLLEAAVSRRPGDLNLLVAMARTYPLDQKSGATERLRWFQAAAASAPDNPAVLNALGKALEENRQLEKAAAYFQKAVDLDPKFANAHNNLGISLYKKGQLNDAIASLRRAIDLDPNDATFHVNLAISLGHAGKADDAIASYQKAVALDPKHAKAHTYLGQALHGKNKLDAAIEHHRKAIDLDPRDAEPHSNLGKVLHDMGKTAEAIASFRNAVALAPKEALVHYNLGLALKRNDQLDEAIECYRKAIALDPKDAEIHAGLGYALQKKGKLDQAIASLRKALELDPKDAETHAHLVDALLGKGQVDEAFDYCRKAVVTDPQFAVAHCNLGNALQGKRRLDEAIGCFEKAIALDPKLAAAQYNLGNALQAKGRVDEAIICFRKTIELDPNFAEAHCNLGHELRKQGHFARALESLQRGHDLGSKRPGWSYPSAAWVRQAQGKALVEANLTKLRKGEYQPRDNTDRLALAVMCKIKKLHRTAAGLYTAAFAADPRLADDLNAAHRDNAACHAAVAAAGQGEDAAKLDDAERTRLRQQALGWLRADLVLRTKQRESGQVVDRAAVKQTMLRWQQDADLAGIRDAAALAKLPADEQMAFTQFWADVVALLKKAEGKENLGPPPVEKTRELAPPPRETK